MITNLDQSLLHLRHAIIDLSTFDQRPGTHEPTDSLLCRKAVRLLTCLSADTDNVFVCLSARHLKEDLNIVARAFEDETIDKLYRAGADHVVSPNVSGAIRMTAMLMRPSLLDFLDVSARPHGLSLRFEQAAVAVGSRVVGKTLAEARIPHATGLLVIALRKKSDNN